MASCVLTVLSLIALALGFAPGTAQAASLTEVTGFGSNPGNLQMFRYVPDGLPAGAPLVVAMHGCNQSAAAFDNETGWTKWADQWGVALVLPQTTLVNNSNTCFKWFEDAHIGRGLGQSLSVKQMVDRMKTDYGVDASRVYATGLSAGGGMTAVMLATYPDVFAGGGVVAGLPYQCSAAAGSPFTCMNPGVNLTPQAWGDKVRAAGGHTGPWPKVSLWQGTSDTTVAPLNMTELVDQWTNVHGIDQTADVSETVKGAAHKVYKDGAGNALVESFSISGMAHGQPVDPGTGAEQCGTAGSWILDANICASFHIGKFWGIDGGTPPPTGGVLTAANNGSQDGYAKANADGSGAVAGTLSGNAAGRGTDGLHNRTVLSFDTSGIPDGATLTRAYVTVAYSSSSGNPWTDPAGNRLLVDAKNGCLGACTIEAADWAAAPTASGVAEIGQFSSGSKASSDFTATGLSAVHKAGTTQLKLRFEQNPAATAYVFVKEGANATLTVEYTP